MKNPSFIPDITYPEIFTTGVILGVKPPERFGIGMAAAGKALGVVPTPDNLMKLAEEWQKVK